MAGPINIGHEALLCCHEQLVSEIAGDPRQMAGLLFQHRFISKATKDKVNELNETREYKARLLVDDIENKIRSFPALFEQFLAILREADVRYTDLIEALEQERTKIGYQDQPTMTLEPLEPELAEDNITGEHTESESLGSSRSATTTSSIRTMNNGHKCIYITVCSCFAFWIIFVLVLGICGAALYNPFYLVSSTNVAQIQRQSVPLIGKLDMNIGNLLQLRVLGSDALPISFYTLQQCSAQDSFVTKHISETVTVGLNTSVESRRVTEWYFTGNTTVNTIITTQILPNYPINFCLAFLVVFDNVPKFNDFLQSPSLEEENYLFTECIINIHSQTSTFFFDKESYYFVGLYSEIPTAVGTFTVEFFGSYLEYKFSNSELICSLNSLNNTACLFSPSRDSLFENACIVGFIPEANTVQSQVKGAAVKLETADLSESTADVYFFIPFILCSTLTVVASLLFCVWWVCHQNRYARTRSNMAQKLYHTVD